MQNDKFAAPPAGFTSAPPQAGYPHPELSAPGMAHPGYQPQPGYPQPQPGYPQPQPGYPQPQPGYPQAGGYPQPGYPQPGFIQQGNPPQFYGAPPGPPPGVSYGVVPPPGAHLPPPEQDATATVVPPNGCFSRNQRNKPQSNAVGAAGLIFISGGMNIAWCIGFRGYIFYYATTHNFIAWFIAAIIGALISCVLANRVPKKFILLFSALLVTIGGVIMAAIRASSAAAIAASYLDGIANGLVFAPFMALAGEVSVPYMRGMIAASTDQMCFGIGIFLQIIYTSSWTYSYIPSSNSFSPENLKGILSAIYGLLALGLGAFLCIESPVLTLSKGDEEGAIDALRRLQRPYTLTNETYEQLAEHKRYLAHNKDISTSKSIVQALPVFARMVYLRAMHALSISYPVIFVLSVSILVNYRGGSASGWLVGFGVCRWLGTLTSTFIMECAGRKKPLLLGLLGCTCLAFAIGAKCGSYYTMDSVTVMLLIFQFFAGLAFTSTSPYLSEAFPLGVKQHFIAFTFIVEMLVFIGTTAAHINIFDGVNYFYAIGGLYLFGFLAGIFCLPETRLTTLRGAQIKFSRIIDRVF